MYKGNLGISTPDKGLFLQSQNACRICGVFIYTEGPWGPSRATGSRGMHPSSHLGTLSLFRVHLKRISLVQSHLTMLRPLPLASITDSSIPCAV